MGAKNHATVLPDADKGNINAIVGAALVQPVSVVGCRHAFLLGGKFMDSDLKEKASGLKVGNGMNPDLTSVSAKIVTIESIT